MGALGKESGLYQKLITEYDNNNDKDITFEFFNKCVDIAMKADKREIRFVLFNLKCLYKENETGSDKANDILNLVVHLFGNSRRSSFMITVLETALDEK